MKLAQINLVPIDPNASISIRMPGLIFVASGIKASASPAFVACCVMD